MCIEYEIEGTRRIMENSFIYQKQNSRTQTVIEGSC